MALYLGGKISVGTNDLPRYFEAAVDPMVTVAGANEPSRVKEGVTIDFEKNVPTEGVALARLECVGGTWLLDPNFQPTKIASDRSGQ